MIIVPMATSSFKPPLDHPLHRRPLHQPSDSFVQSLARGLGVIRSFSAQKPSQTLTDVAQATDLTRAGARRSLLTLQTLGYVGGDGKYFWLTPKILDLGFAYLSAMPLWNLAEPVMERLSRELGESCSAAVLDQSDIVYVMRVPARKVMSISLGVGSRLPAYCSSMGRMLLAELGDDEVRALLSAGPLPSRTTKTLTDVDAVLAQVELARRQAWCLVDQELEEGLVSMAAPIKDRSGRTVAALNISGQVMRTSARVMRSTMLPQLQGAAQDISRMLGAT